jgi:hypothetical protein
VERFSRNSGCRLVSIGTSKRLFVRTAEQMKWFDADMGPIDDRMGVMKRRLAENAPREEGAARRTLCRR